MAPPPDPVGKNIEEAMKMEMQKQCGPGMEIPNNDLSPSKIAAGTNEPHKAVQSQKNSQGLSPKAGWGCMSYS